MKLVLFLSVNIIRIIKIHSKKEISSNKKQLKRFWTRWRRWYSKKEKNQCKGILRLSNMEEKKQCCTKLKGIYNH